MRSQNKRINNSISNESTKPIKVLFLHNIPAPYRIPLFEELSQREDIKFKFLFYTQSYRQRKWKIKKMNFEFDYLSGLTVEVGSFVTSINPEIIKTILKGDYDVIIVSGLSDLTTFVALVISKMKGMRRLIYSEGTKDGQGRLSVLIDIWSSFWVKTIDGMILPGMDSKNFYRRLGAKEQHIHIAPDAVDNDYFIKESDRLACQRMNIREKLGLTDSIALLYVGQLVYRKGVDTLIQAFSNVKKQRPNLSLLIVGDGPERNKLEELSIKSGTDGIQFYGWVDEEIKNQLYAAADVFVLPTRSDVWGLVINEAMCNKLPIISTKQAGASADLVKDDVNGYVIPADNTLEIERAILMITKDKLKMKTMGKESYILITSNNSIKEEASGFIQAIQDVIEQKALGGL